MLHRLASMLFCLEFGHCKSTQVYKYIFLYFLYLTFFSSPKIGFTPFNMNPRNWYLSYRGIEGRFFDQGKFLNVLKRQALIMSKIILRILAEFMINRPSFLDNTYVP